ncbi:MAG: hypothetical protein R2880_20970 [Deinococcales bacterium]
MLQWAMVISAPRPTGQIFTIFYILSGLGVVATFISSLGEKHRDYRESKKSKP